MKRNVNRNPISRRTRRNSRVATIDFTTGTHPTFDYVSNIPTTFTTKTIKPKPKLYHGTHVLEGLQPPPRPRKPVTQSLIPDLNKLPETTTFIGRLNLEVEEEMSEEESTIEFDPVEVIESSYDLLVEDPPEVPPTSVHRLQFLNTDQCIFGLYCDLCFTSLKMQDALHAYCCKQRKHTICKNCFFIHDKTHTSGIWRLNLETPLGKYCSAINCTQK